MELQTAFETRRSIRHYDAEKKVTKEQVETLNCFPSSRQLKKIKSYFCHSFESGGSFFMLPTYIVCIFLLELILLNFVAIFYCYNNQCSFLSCL